MGVSDIETQKRLRALENEISRLKKRAQRHIVREYQNVTYDSAVNLQYTGGDSLGSVYMTPIHPPGILRVKEVIAACSSAAASVTFGVGIFKYTDLQKLYKGGTPDFPNSSKRSLDWALVAKPEKVYSTNSATPQFFQFVFKTPVELDPWEAQYAIGWHYSHADGRFHGGYTSTDGWPSHRSDTGFTDIGTFPSHITTSGAVVGSPAFVLRDSIALGAQGRY